MNPSFLNLFAKKLTRERVVPRICIRQSVKRRWQSLRADNFRIARHSGVSTNVDTFVIEQNRGVNFRRIAISVRIVLPVDAELFIGESTTLANNKNDGLIGAIACLP